MRYRKCETCGSHGHGGRACPVYRLNQQQERRREQRRHNVSFGLTPELEREIILIRKAWKIAAALGSLLLCATSLFAGTITGRLQTATGGAVTNGTLSFRLSQPAVIVGTASLVTSPASCYISAAGNIVGVPDPLVAPVLSANTISGTLPAGTYFVVLTYAGASGESVASPESTVILSASGTLIVQAPVKQPANATGYNVYIGSASGTETLQASVTGFTQYSQTSALSAGAAVPSSNTSTCSLAFSDQLIPSGTYYSVNLVNRNGSTLAGFPQTWCTFGGQSGTINVSNGAPTGNCGTNGVIYPTPILANPQNNAPQSISSPLTLQGTVLAASNFTALAGQNSFNAFSINGVIIVDGCAGVASPKYACTPAGIQAAITQAQLAPPFCGSVYNPPAFVAMGGTQITIPSCVKVSGAGVKQTIWQWTSNLASGAIGMTSPNNSYLGNLELNFNSGNTSSAIRITGSDAVGALDNTFENILIDFSTLGGIGSAGIQATSFGPSFTDVDLNTFRNIIINTADQAVLCQGCEGNYWQVVAQNMGAHAGAILFNEQSPNNNDIGDIRMESGSGNFANEICLQVAGSNNQFRLTCDGNLTGITAVNDLGSYNRFDVGAIGSPTLGTIAATSQDCFVASSIGQSNCSFPGATIGQLNVTAQLGLANLLFSRTAPTIASGFGTSPSIVVSNGTAVFKVNVGTGGTATGGVITMPAAATDWVCDVKNITALAANRANQWTAQTAGTSTSVTVQNQTISTGAALAWTASDIVLLKCGGE